MFRVIIDGKTIDELRQNLATFGKSLYAEVKPGPAHPEEQEDFLTQVAAEGPNENTLSSNQPLPIMSVPTAVNSGVPNGTADVDSKGFPWDARIHASSHEKSKDGSWRYRRGVEEGAKRAVEYELIDKMKKAQLVEMEAPPVPASFPPAVPNLAPVAQPVAPAPAAPVATPVVPPMPPPVTLPNAHTLDTFKKHLIPTLAKLVKDGKLTHDYVNQLKSHFGVEEIHKLSDEQIEEMFNMFVQYGMIAKAQ